MKKGFSSQDQDHRLSYKFLSFKSETNFKFNFLLRKIICQPLFFSFENLEDFFLIELFLQTAIL